MVPFSYASLLTAHACRRRHKAYYFSRHCKSSNTVDLYKHFFRIFPITRPLRNCLYCKPVLGAPPAVCYTDVQHGNIFMVREIKTLLIDDRESDADYVRSFLGKLSADYTFRIAWETDPTRALL